MRLPAHKVKEAILHSDPEVREAAVYYFARSFSTDPSIMPLAIQAIAKFGWEEFEATSFLRDLVQTDETVDWLIQEIEQLDPAASEQAAAYADTLVSALRRADPAVLKRFQPAIERMQQLDEFSREAISDRIFLHSFSFDALWQELTSFCNERADEIEIAPDEQEHITAVVDALRRYPELAADRVQAVMDTDNVWLEQLAVSLAGELRLRSLIPSLLTRAGDPDSWAEDEAYWALIKIGGDAVVEEIASRHWSEEWGFRVAAAVILEEIHTDRSVELALDLFRREEDDELQGHLLQAALMNFETEAIEPARQFVLARPKAPDLLEVRSALLVACKMLGVTFPEFEAWSEDARHDVEFRRQWYRDEDEVEDESPVTVVRRAERIRNIDKEHSTAMSKARQAKFPIGTVAFYGPDDKRTTKVVAAVIKWEGAMPVLQRWVGSRVDRDVKVQRAINTFFARHHVKSVVVTDGNIGCPHEEGPDFPVGQDCPFCPFWAGKQGTGR